MSEYHGFRYQALLKNGQWWLVFPSGFKTTLFCANEDEVKAAIDEIISNAGAS